MPEEQAFSILVSLMYDYGLRDLYKDGFDNLYLRLYQLSRLIQDQLPKLHEHFAANGVETHMFASQWFLTLFTARFPLYFVFHIMDVVLLDGIDILFQVAMTLLEKYESELRQQDFEGVLRFFRVTLPKKCRNTSNARKLMKAVCDRKIKKLKHYKEEYMANKEAAEKEEQAMKQFEQRFDNERNKYKTEILALQDNIRKCGAEMKRKSDIIDDYKQIIQRREQQVTEMNNLLTEYAVSVRGIFFVSFFLCTEFILLIRRQTHRNAPRARRVSVELKTNRTQTRPAEAKHSRWIRSAHWRWHWIVCGS